MYKVISNNNLIGGNFMEGLLADLMEILLICLSFIGAFSLMYLEYALNWNAGWITLSMIITGIAISFNRSPMKWFIFGIIGGPIALFILVAFVGKTEK